MKIQLPSFIHAQRNWRGDINYSVCAADMSQYGYLFVCEQLVTVEIPDDFDPTRAAIAMLKQKQETARAEFNETVRQINEEISKLQAIEYTPAADSKP